MTEKFKAYLSDLLNETIVHVASVHGGDISDAYKLETSREVYFLKCHSGQEAIKMFEAEAKGLKLIGETKSIRTPEVLGLDTFDNTSFLILEFIPSKSPDQKDHEALGTQLAHLHLNTTTMFGLDHDNKIGKLPQSNTQHKSWPGFYARERLLPQLHLAKEKGLLKDSDCPDPERIESVLNEIFKNVKPSLVHGDLWSGNYLISETGTPYLIDPAVYYSDGLVDIAMSKLFGGFGSGFYNAYHEMIPKPETYSERIDLYQLYYLLVHLNLFGAAYRSGVRGILSRYF
ncbi:fructosamine kinase family protein [Gaetbulibacter aestuarii]|uniref:Fructosamine kinase family protein n=1 Tax=Gaetbulibacter aestuarii TaxID=1502358 RepID=A0ABW7MXG3_9FLAO